MKTRGSVGIAPPFLTPASAGGWWSTSRPGRFIPAEIATGTHWTGGWVGPRAGLDDVDVPLTGCEMEHTITVVM
jgi:hypothetical protein